MTRTACYRLESSLCIAAATGANRYFILMQEEKVSGEDSRDTDPLRPMQAIESGFQESSVWPHVDFEPQRIRTYSLESSIV